MSGASSRRFLRSSAIASSATRRGTACPSRPSVSRMCGSPPHRKRPSPPRWVSTATRVAWRAATRVAWRTATRVAWRARLHDACARVRSSSLTLVSAGTRHTQPSLARLVFYLDSGALGLHRRHSPSPLFWTARGRAGCARAAAARFPEPPAAAAGTKAAAPPRAAAGSRADQSMPGGGGRAAGGGGAAMGAAMGAAR